jgi:hypothetical protein
MTKQERETARLGHGLLNVYFELVRLKNKLLELSSASIL